MDAQLESGTYKGSQGHSHGLSGPLIWQSHAACVCVCVRLGMTGVLVCVRFDFLVFETT